MGEVYKGRDTRLNRVVAIKILASDIADDASLRARFEREAQAVAALDHPHICGIYDVGEANGTHFLVMPFLEGQTLAARLEHGALPLDQTLKIAAEIADALDKAHRQGIIHRDVKPANIMLTKAGSKLLDFGVAKLKAPAGSMAEMTGGGAATLTTALGTVLGTVQYMAPEQLEGKDADARSDIFAFGATLYEMMTGRKAFDGSTQASVIAAILHTEPLPLLQIQPTVPPAIDWLIHTCLAKDPDERWQRVHDVNLQLRRIGSVDSISARTTDDRWWRLAAIVGLSGVISLAAVLSVLVYRGRPAPVSNLVARFELSVDPEQLLPLDVQRVVAMSPDGTRLAYVAARRGKTQIYVRGLNDFRAGPLSGTENGSDPFFSPDARWLGFSANGQLKKVPLAGGAPVKLADAPVTFGASWGPDGSIIYAPNPVGGLFGVHADGGPPQAVTTLDTANGELAHRWPHVLPDGKAVLFTVWRGGTFDDGRIVVQRFDTRVRTTVLEGGTDARYLPTGHLVYARAASIMAVPFDLGQLRVTGPPVQVLEELEANVVTGAAHFSVSGNGSLAFVPGTTAKFRLVDLDRQGNSRELPVPARIFNQPRLAADGRRLAFAVRGVDTDIWLSEIDRGGLSRLTSEPGENETPVWSSDGRRIAYSSSRAGQPRTIFSKPADLSGQEKVLRTSQLASHLSSWSRDGVLAFTEFKGLEGDIWVLPPNGAARVFLETPFNEHGAMFSPDGRWLAYTSDESGQDEVYVQAFPGPGAKRQISIDGGSEPAWTKSGAELLYRNADKLMTVSIRQTPAFDNDAPRVLFHGIFESDHRGDTNYDVSADGRRLVVIKSSRQFTRFNLVLNWFEELRERISKAR